MKRGLVLNKAERRERRSQIVKMNEPREAAGASFTGLRLILQEEAKLNCDLKSLCNSSQRCVSVSPQ